MNQQEEPTEGSNEKTEQVFPPAEKGVCPPPKSAFTTHELAAEILHYLHTDIPQTVVAALTLTLKRYGNTGEWVTETEQLIGEQEPPLTVQRMQQERDEAIESRKAATTMMMAAGEELLLAKLALHEACEDCDHGVRGGKICESCHGTGQVLIADLLQATRQHVKELKESLANAQKQRESDLSLASQLTADLAHEREVLASYRGSFTFQKERAERAEKGQEALKELVRLKDLHDKCDLGWRGQFATYRDYELACKDYRTNKLPAWEAARTALTAAPDAASARGQHEYVHVFGQAECGYPGCGRFVEQHETATERIWRLNKELGPVHCGPDLPFSGAVDRRLQEGQENDVWRPKK